MEEPLEEKMGEEDGARLWDQPAFKMVKFIVPWLLLVVVLFKVNGIFNDYQSAAKLADKNAAEASASLTSSGTPAKGANKKLTQLPGVTGGTVTVLIDGLNLRSRPVAAADVVKVLGEGEVLSLMKQDGKWLLAKTSDGKTGWVSASKKYVKVEKK